MEAEKIMHIVEQYLKKDFELGAKDRGFAATVLTDFISNLENYGAKIVFNSDKNGN